MQCGPIRFHLSPKKAAQSSPLEHKVIPRFTDFAWNGSENETAIHDIYGALVTDHQRNDLIVKDLEQALSNGRSPLVLKGGMGAKRRKQIAESVALVSIHEPRMILATGSYLG